MHSYFSSEVNSADIPSDNPIFQRTKKAYEIVAKNKLGKVLEVGCGEGYGIPILLKNSTSFIGIDKNQFLIKKLKSQSLERSEFIHQSVPPLHQIDSESVNTVVCFQVLEHVPNATELIHEMYRVLIPGGKLFLTTPNAIKSVSRNPWHVKEYTGKELQTLLSEFKEVTISGIVGNRLASEYYRLSNIATQKTLKWDVLSFSRWFPSVFLYLPYEIINRYHRRQLAREYPNLVLGITSEDYVQIRQTNEALDIFSVSLK